MAHLTLSFHLKLSGKINKIRDKNFWIRSPALRLADSKRAPMGLTQGHFTRVLGMRARFNLRFALHTLSTYFPLQIQPVVTW